MRKPNPWITAPALLAGVLAAVIGWVVTDVSCRQEIEGVVVTCAGWRLAITVIAGLATTLGIMVLLVLVYRSIAEHADDQESSAAPE